MTILVTLTLAGADTGPFNLYSDADGFSTALATGISKAALEAGYSLTGVPDDATIIRTQSTGTCTNFIDMFISGTITTTTTSSTTSTTTTIALECITGDRNALATCSGGESALFTVTAGNTALITPGGYYYSGTGTRYYTAYIMDATNAFVLYTFNYTQAGSNPGTWTSNLPDNTLPTGSYRLRVDTVNCSTNGSGTFSLVASCNTTTTTTTTTSDGYYYYNVQRYDCTQECAQGTTAIGRATNALDIGYFYHPPASTDVYEILSATTGSYYNVDLYGSPSRATCSEACGA
jgi:hypothetical protein